MGTFDLSEQNIEDIYNNKIRSLLIRDDSDHVVMINSFSQFPNETFGPDQTYTQQIDGIISYMYQDLITVKDIKFESLQGKEAENLERFHTLITYNWPAENPLMKESYDAKTHESKLENTFMDKMISEIHGHSESWYVYILKIFFGNK